MTASLEETVRQEQEQHDSATDRDGDLDVVIGEKTVKVVTVYIPAAEEL